MPVQDADSIVRIVTRKLRPGRTASFEIVRGGKRRAITVRLAERPPGS
jgi:S1-C subfamily serine protease